MQTGLLTFEKCNDQLKKKIDLYIENFDDKSSHALSTGVPRLRALEFKVVIASN